MATSKSLSVLLTNHVTKEEAESLRATIPADLEASEQLRFRIEALLEEVEQLRIEREALEKGIAAKVALCAPIRRVPPEIMTRIFTLCLPAEPGFLHSSEAPLLLTHVSHQWRGLVNAYKPFWTTVKISSGFLHYIPRLLTQSYPLEFSLSIYAYGDMPDTQSALQGIQLHMDRCVSLDVDVPSTSWFRHILAPGTVTSAPVLENIRLEAGHRYANLSKMGKLDAPRLRSVEVQDVTAFSMILVSPTTSLSRLLVMPESDERYCSPRAYQPFVTSCSNLRQLQLYFNDMDVLDFTPDLIEMPLLTHCHIRFDTVISVTQLLDLFRFPALEHFHLQFFRRPPGPGTGSMPIGVTSFHVMGPQRKAPPLKELLLEHFDFTSPDFILNLSDLPLLERLEFTRCAGVGGIISLLTPVPGNATSTWMYPKLSRLAISESRLPGGNNVLLPFIDARAKRVADGDGIADIRLWNCRGLARNHIDILKTSVDQLEFLSVSGLEDGSARNPDEGHWWQYH